MMSSFLPYFILSCMLYKTVVTQVSVSLNGNPTNGATIMLTCSITSFSLPSSWINDTSSGILSTCRNTGTCSPTTSGRYSYSATNSTIVAQISAFDASIDNFGWKCRHDIDTYVYKFTFTITQVSVSSNNDNPANGATITLTCSITSFSLPSSWINDTSSGSLSTCLRAGTCSPTTSGRYSYSATNSTIVAQISAFNASIDNFGWKCRHKSDTHVYTFTFTTIPSSSGPASTRKETVTSTSSPSTSMSSATIKATTNSTSATHSATESTATASISTSSSTNSATGSNASASASSSTSASKSPTAGSTVTVTSTSKPTTPETVGSTSTSPTNNGSQVGTDTKVIIIAVVVPIGGLLLIVIIVLCIRYHRTGKKGHDIPDGMAAQDRGNTIDGFKHDMTDKQLNAIPTTSDGFIIYPDPAAMSTARPNKERKYCDVAYQYKTPYTSYQTAYVPSTYPSAKSSTHKDTKHHNVGHPYSRPYTGTYDNQTAYSPKNKSYDYESPYQIAASRPAFDRTAYYPQTGYYEQNGQDIYPRGSGQYSYGQRSRPHQDHNGRQQQREYYYNQYEMADFGGSRTQYGQTKQYGLDTAIFY